jgi:hypothetical protein
MGTYWKMVVVHGEKKEENENKIAFFFNQLRAFLSFNQN